MSPYINFPAMEHSRTLRTAQLQFIEDRLSLVRIPLSAYANYVQAILKLLYPLPPHGQNGAVDAPNGHSPDAQSNQAWASQHPFLNVSVTPIECSLICSKRLAEDHIVPAISAAGGRDGASVSSEDLVAISVEGEGLEAGQRVLELTSPLAMAGISIFFFTTYFSDYILVPCRARAQVVRALEERGFALDRAAHAYVNPSAQHHARNTSGGSNSSSSSSEAPPLSPTITMHEPPPSTPPPTSLSELQTRTAALLKRRAIRPQLHPTLRLIPCAGRSPPSASSLPPAPGTGGDDLALLVGATRALLHPPPFFSLTLTASEAPSFLLEPSSLRHFPSPDTLLGAKDDYLVPVTLDLGALPLQAPGIVCGVAARLVGGATDEGEGIEMSYLSTARGAAVMVPEGDLARAAERLGLEDSEE